MLTVLFYANKNEAFAFSKYENNYDYQNRNRFCFTRGHIGYIVNRLEYYIIRRYVF